MINHNKVIISAYADDTVLYLQDINSLKKSIQIFQIFQLLSGLEINLEKSELLAFGNFCKNPPDITDTGI